MGPLFEPLTSSSFLLLCQKTALLVANTSATRVCELQALVEEPPYMLISKDIVTLQPQPKFLYKAMSQFHLNHLSVFFPKPYYSPREQCLPTLDVRQCLAFYLDRTKPFCASPCLFVSYGDRMTGKAVSS